MTLAPDRMANDSFAQGTDRAPTARTLYAMSRIYAARGMDDQCRLALGQIIRDHPEFVPAYNDMAELQLRSNRLDAATNTLQRGLAMMPEDPVLLNNLGMCLLLEGNYPLALQQFDLAVAAAPGNERYQANQAAALGLLGEYERAMTIYRDLLGEAAAHYNLGVLSRARRDFERASREFQLAESGLQP